MYERFNLNTIHTGINRHTDQKHKHTYVLYRLILFTGAVYNLYMDVSFSLSLIFRLYCWNLGGNKCVAFENCLILFSIIKLKKERRVQKEKLYYMSDR